MIGYSPRTLRCDACYRAWITAPAKATSVEQYAVEHGWTLVLHPSTPHHRCPHCSHRCPHCSRKAQP